MWYKPDMKDFEFRLPDIGEGLAEAEVVQWRVSVGDNVQENQTVVEIETDKAIVEIPSPATGVVKHLPVAPGQRVKVGAVLLGAFRFWCSTSEVRTYFRNNSRQHGDLATYTFRYSRARKRRRQFEN